MLDLTTSIIVRVSIITAVASIISYFLMKKYAASPDKLRSRMPLLFVVVGVAVLINVLYAIQRSGITNPH